MRVLHSDNLRRINCSRELGIRRAGLPERIVQPRGMQKYANIVNRLCEYLVFSLNV